MKENLIKGMTVKQLHTILVSNGVSVDKNDRSKRKALIPLAMSLPYKTLVASFYTAVDQSTN